ncbi:MAG: PAS domain S-box protein [Chitinophagaceae bacterium]|nr:PAS domain S-box protein [Chitinophagaceae bacterium]
MPKENQVTVPIFILCYQKSSNRNMTTESQLHIGIIDDDEDDLFLITEYLNNIPSQQFKVSPMLGYEEGLRNIRRHKCDIYFVDYYLGPRTGLELIKELISENYEEPFVLLTGKGNTHIDKEAIKSGAFDYLVKGELNPEKLERCIRYSLERAASLTAIRESERKFRTIFEQSKDPIFIADEDLVFKNLNKAAVKLLEYSFEELQSLSLYTLLSEEIGKTLKEKFTLERIVDDMEVEIITKKGVTKYCTLSISAEMDARGSSHVQGILHDISKLKQAEYLNLQMQKKEVTGRLIHFLAHEVRNPLNNIQLSVDQIEEQVGSPKDINDYLKIIRRNSTRINGIINHLLSSANPAEITLRERTLQVIIDDSLTEAIDRITLKKIKIKIDYASEPLLVKADSAKLQIAFLNLFINAIEAMEEGKGVLSIEVFSSAKEHFAAIKDNGIGMTKEQMNYLFEPFHTRKPGGLGLGLPMVSNILHLHNATIDVQSEPNAGTTFLIGFPVL